MKTLLLGAGNLLLSDEGFGVHLVRYLQQHCVLPEEVELLDAGTMGILVTHQLEQADRVFIVDVVAADAPPGTCLRYAKEDFLLKRIPLKLSPHQIGLQEMLLVSELRGRCPKEVVLFGIVPASVAPGIELSPVLREQLPAVAAQVLGEL